jgi:Zn-dependent alcohol dehydrogenase
MTAMLISAAVLRAADAPYTIEQAKLSDPGPGEVLVKIAGAGLCHTDVLEGDAVPQLFIPRLIQLWKQGRFPFDRLITTYPLSQINQAEAAAASGTAVKPVLVPDQ